MRRTNPFEPFEPIEPAEPLLRAISGRVALWANLASQNCGTMRKTTTNDQE